MNPAITVTAIYTAIYTALFWLLAAWVSGDLNWVADLFRGALPGFWVYRAIVVCIYVMGYYLALTSFLYD